MQWRKLREPGNVALAVLCVVAVVLGILQLGRGSVTPGEVDGLQRSP